jgi:integration host factor subunit beta
LLPFYRSGEVGSVVKAVQASQRQARIGKINAGLRGGILVGKGVLLMTKKGMAKAIADEMGLTQAQAREIVQRVFDGIVATLVNEGRIELRSFGVFEVRKRKPRQARNPRTGEKVWVLERMVVSFKPGLEMQERVLRLQAVAK